MAYLRWLMAYFQGNVVLVAAAYNAGEGAVNRYRGVPPYAETLNYVRLRQAQDALRASCVRAQYPPLLPPR
jgi:soluble lytic murein transglycosylase-like protein